VDEGEFYYELEDAGNDLFSGNHSRREPSSSLFLNLGERQKRRIKNVIYLRS